MIKKSIREIARMVGATNDVSRFADTVIAGVSIDTRTLEKGNLFIPLRGERHDGHQFVPAAFERGAAATLWQEDVPGIPEDQPVLVVKDTLQALQELARLYRQELDLKVCAVTGSNGKTTTKDILAGLLSLKFKVQKTRGNFNNHIGLPLTILGLAKDTEVAVLEMGMNHFGEIDFLSRLARPDAVIITNIGDAHLQELGSREGICQAKMEILNGLKEGGLFVYLGDEPLIENELAKRELTFSTRTFGRGTDNDLYPLEIKINASGSSFRVNQAEETFHLPIMGEYNVLNALAAMLVAREWGVPFARMNEAFAQIKLSEMRMELRPGLKGSVILNDAYNASPTSMKAVLDLVSSLKGYTKKIVVLGDMLELGPQEKEFHREIGAYIDPEKIYQVYTYGPLGAYIAEAAAKKLGAERTFAFDDKAELVAKLKENLDANTLVLVKASRGMKMEEIVAAIEADDE